MKSCYKLPGILLTSLALACGSQNPAPSDIQFYTSGGIVGCGEQLQRYGKDGLRARIGQNMSEILTGFERRTGKSPTRYGVKINLDDDGLFEYAILHERDTFTEEELEFLRQRLQKACG